jgi:PAS domain S-box-containing protein
LGLTASVLAWEDWRIMPTRPSTGRAHRTNDCGIPSGTEIGFRSALDKLPAAAYTCDATGLITYFNDHAVSLWGRSPKLNDPVDRFCGSFKLFAADGSPVRHDQCWMALTLMHGREYNRQEIIVERPNGERATVLAHASPIFDDEGKLLGAVNVLVDISDHKNGEQAQALLSAIVRSSDDAIISKTLEGRILSWNLAAERLFGYTEAEAVGNSILLIIPPERQDEEREILTRLRRGERIEHFETVRQAKDGRRIDISLTISPLRDRTGKIVGASKIARDITLQKSIQEALARANQRKDEFLATLAHELRNPLAPISNSLHLLRLTEHGGPAAQRILAIMEQQVRHLGRLVDDLLDISRITSGKIELRKEPVELAALVADAVETSRPHIVAAGQQLALRLPAEPVTIDADPLRIGQVISNLLNNAAKYTPSGGQIWLTAWQQKGEAVVSVRDSGIGIPPEMLGRVFDLFAQVDRTHRRAQGGLGIGLTLAKSLVQMHGGRIEARSDGLGKGSEFVVTLPVSHTAPVTSVRPLRPPPKPQQLPKRSILVVDDMRDAGYVLGKLLENLGQQVQTVHDARSALEYARRERPDIVISDIGMPDMDGYELARALRAEPLLKDTVLVALTGYGQETDRRRAEEAGFDRHLVKPADIEALHDLLASLPTLV